jgi:hypothetical protein
MQPTQTILKKTAITTAGRCASQTWPGLHFRFLIRIADISINNGDLFFFAPDGVQTITVLETLYSTAELLMVKNSLKKDQLKSRFIIN